MNRTLDLVSWNHKNSTTEKNGLSLNYYSHHKLLFTAGENVVMYVQCTYVSMMIDVEFRCKQIVFNQSHVIVANGVAHMFFVKNVRIFSKKPQNVN